MQALNPLEKLLLGFANLILGNRYMRGLFVVYAAGLHLFVVLTVRIASFFPLARAYPRL